MWDTEGFIKPFWRILKKNPTQNKAAKQNSLWVNTATAQVGKACSEKCTAVFSKADDADAINCMFIFEFIHRSESLCLQRHGDGHFSCIQSIFSSRALTEGEKGGGGLHCNISGCQRIRVWLRWLISYQKSNHVIIESHVGFHCTCSYILTSRWKVDGKICLVNEDQVCAIHFKMPVSFFICISGYFSIQISLWSQSLVFIAVSFSCP